MIITELTAKHITVDLMVLVILFVRTLWRLLFLLTETLIDFKELTNINRNPTDQISAGTTIISSAQSVAYIYERLTHCSTVKHQ